MANEKRLIDANALAEQFSECNFKGFVMKRLIEMQPTVDAVEVVRGKDCKHSACNPVELTYACRHPRGLRGFVNEGYYFCSYGERRVDSPPPF